MQEADDSKGQAHDYLAPYHPDVYISKHSPARVSVRPPALPHCSPCRQLPEAQCEAKRKRGNDEVVSSNFLGYKVRRQETQHVARSSHESIVMKR